LGVTAQFLQRLAKPGTGLHAKRILGERKLIGSGGARRILREKSFDV
jgi:hypothetical protein